ncbi:MAG: ABC transporter permease [Acidimicrobiia bacterium]
MTGRTLAIGARVTRQIRGDRRFAAAMIIIPILLLVFLKVVFDAMSVPDIVQRRYAVLGVSYVIHFVAFLLTALVVVGERVQGTLGRMFINGYRRLEIVGGYLGAYTLFATLQSVLVLVVAHYLFDLHYSIGEMGQIFLVLWLLAILMMSIGILVSNLARNVAQVIPFVPAIVVPALFLSGIVVAVSKLPTWAQVVARITPLYYSTQVYQSLFSEGSIFGDIWAFLLLPALAIVVLGFAAMTLREEL